MDNLSAFDTRGKTCASYHVTPELCGFYDTAGPTCEMYKTDPRGCVGNFTASEDCCACGGQRKRFFCCNYVDWDNIYSSCDLFEGREINHRDSEYSTKSATYVLNYEDGNLINGTENDPENCDEWFNLQIGDESIIYVFGHSFVPSIGNVLEHSFGPSIAISA